MLHFIPPPQEKKKKKPPAEREAYEVEADVSATTIHVDNFLGMSKRAHCDLLVFHTKAWFLR